MRLTCIFIRNSHDRALTPSHENCLFSGMDTTQQPTVEFAQLVSRGCGLDVHKDVLVATIQGQGLRAQTRSFGAFTQDIEELADWLRTHQVTHVAMESTGVYWKPVFNVLGEAFEILLVNARHIKHVPGHKTDKKDSEWLVKLLLAGLLKASFVPPQQVREWRDLFRYQRKATGHIAAEWNRILKVLEDANIKLSSVLTDISGVSGRQMLEALSRGQTNVDELLKLAHGRLKAKRDELKKALVGKLTRHHQFMLTTLLRSITQQEALIADINQQIDSQVAEWQEAVDLLQTIPGVGHHTAVGLLAEIGTNMEQFPSEKHLASWAGMAPGNHESAGKKKVPASPMAVNI